MKNINLMPPNLRPRRFGSGFSRKLFTGCLIVPAALLVAVFGIFEIYRYWYEDKPAPPPEELSEPLVLTETSPGGAPVDRAEPLSSTVPTLESAIPSGAQIQAELSKPAPIIGTTGGEPEPAEGYTLRLGLFVGAGKAEALVRQLQQRKVRVFQQVKQEERNVYTVFLDGFTTYEGGMIEARKLEKDLFPAEVQFQEHGVRVKVESFLTHDNAKEMAEQLNSRGYPAKITKEFIPLTIYQVKSGPFANYREAKEHQLTLEREGFHSVILFKEQ